ncbi:cytochrome P460 family protein [Planococcus citreus]|uniref:Cytochrome P460 n=1 Tax=Planococcus citreus TaxID=1373 RepID=A0A497YFB7_9BACL|nr:cytochrome P460 family protein [Planococcus citreus]RLJ87004.1 cytochrome P460 [Planococcus citreus]
MKKFLVQPFILVALTLVLIACSNREEPVVPQDSMGDETQTTDAQTSDSQNNQESSATSLIQLPENYEEGVLYTTVTRGSAFEELFTSEEAIEAVQNGEPVPSGTVMTLKIYEDEVLDRIFVMEKRDDWDPEILPEQRNGEWAYQSFDPEGALNEGEDIGRCISCHAGQENDDFLYKLDEMKTYDLEALAGQEDSAAFQFADSHSSGWGVMEVDADSGQALTQVAQGGENLLTNGPESQKVVQDVLLRMYINGLES